MSERISILSEIRSGGYEASLITTFNAYLPFYEDVVLRHLLGSGIRHNVLMMDATQTTLAVDRHPPRSAGRLYTLAPIKVPGAFHPKVILLVGKKKGTLLVGSHNLTLSGFGYNREMTNVILYKGENDTEGAALLNSAWQNILGWAGSQSNALPGHIIEMVKKVQDFAPWLQNVAGDLPKNCRVLSTGPAGPTLWQQLTEFSGPEPVSEIIVSGAFFDSHLTFVKNVRDELSPKELTVGIDPASAQLPAGNDLPGVSFVNCAKLGVTEKEDKQAGYLHAKSILLQREDGETILAVGSANPSYPAWLAPGMSQNVEMMIARKGADAKDAADELGLLAIASMPLLIEEDWQEINKNWESETQPEQDTQAAQVLIALATDHDIRFRVQGVFLPETIECSIFVAGSVPSENRQADLSRGEYVLATEGLPPVSIIRFSILDRNFTGLVQHVKTIEGLSRTTSQRKFNEALSSLATGMPNLEHFVDCIKEIIKISDSVSTTRGAGTGAGRRREEGTNTVQTEGAELSIGLDEVVEQEHLHKQRLRGADDLGYLLDVLLYNLRDESSNGLEDALEERDAMGRTEEEQVDADDDDDEVVPTPVRVEHHHVATVGSLPLAVCHRKVGDLVGAACEKLEALRQSRLEMAQFVVIMAGILSALRLLRGLDGKVSWIGSGETAVPKKELRKLFNKVAEVLYDGDKSILFLNESSVQLSIFDEFSRLKGLILWLAWDSGITFAAQKPFNESTEERIARFNDNRLYVATAQLIAVDEDVISEARQSIGQLCSSDMGWLEKLIAVDQLLRNFCSNPTELQDGAWAKSGDFGFNSLKPELGIREVLPKDNAINRFLSLHYESTKKYMLPAHLIRTIPFERILKG